jgi:hypothetical protein
LDANVQLNLIDYGCQRPRNTQRKAKTGFHLHRRLGGLTYNIALAAGNATVASMMIDS